MNLNKMTYEQLHLLKIIRGKKVPHLVECETNTLMPLGLTKKKHKTYANGKVIAANIASALVLNGMAKW